jgi:hypothetical protein
VRTFPLIEITPARKFSIFGGFTLFRAKKDGGLFLKGEKTSIWDINGFLLQTKKHRVMVVFKRSRLTRAMKRKIPTA